MDLTIHRHQISFLILSNTGSLEVYFGTFQIHCRVFLSLIIHRCSPVPFLCNLNSIDFKISNGRENF